MIDTTPIVRGSLQRIPGLYRRWELPQLIELQRLYHLEDAGAHADGTPLLAVYTTSLDGDVQTGGSQ